MVELVAFLGKAAPFCGRVGSIAFPRVAMNSETTQEEEKAVFRGFLPSLENQLSCRHQGKGPRFYTAAEAESKGLVARISPS